MDAGISVGHVQLKSILRSNSIPPKASSQVVTFGPTVTIATDPAYGSNSEESENEKILAENKSNGQSDLDAEKPDYPEHNKEAVDEDGSDAGSDDSVVCLDDKTEDDINQVMISLISESFWNISFRNQSYRTRHCKILQNRVVSTSSKTSASRSRICI